MKHKILICDNIHRTGIDLIRSQPDFEVEVARDFADLDLSRVVEPFHGIIIRDSVRIDSPAINAAINLKVIGRAGANLDNIDVSEATKRGIAVMNTPGGSVVANAEHTVSLIMSAHRHICQATASMKSGKWEKKKFQGREIAGRTIGIIGLGTVGLRVAELASRGLKLNVIGFDPTMTAEAISNVGIRPVSLNELLSKADIITLHLTLKQDSGPLITSETLELVKPGSILINASRSAVVDESALLDALTSGRVGAAALDYFTKIPPENTELITHPNVIATPQLGAATEEAEIGTSVAIVSQVIDFFQNGVIRNAVNVPIIDTTRNPKIVPYLDLARRLGQFLGNMAEGSIEELEIEYRGEMAGWDLKPITISALVGFMSVFEQDVNFVNAPVFALQRGIRVSETVLKESTNYGPSLELRIKPPNSGISSIQGALIRRIGDEPRIIGIGEFVTEAVPAGPMLIVTNFDVPGMIAGMSGALAARKINIAQMNLSRDCIGGKAMSIINLDSPVDAGTLSLIRDIDGIISVKQVILDEQPFRGCLRP